MSSHVFLSLFVRFEQTMMRIKGNVLARSIALLLSPGGAAGDPIRKEPLVSWQAGEDVSNFLQSEAWEDTNKQFVRLLERDMPEEHKEVFQKVIGWTYLWLALTLYFGSATLFKVTQPSTTEMIDLIGQENKFDDFSEQATRIFQIQQMIGKLLSIYRGKQFGEIIAILFDTNTRYAHRMFVVDMLLQNVNGVLLHTLNDVQTKGRINNLEWMCLKEFLDNALLPKYRRMDVVISKYIMSPGELTAEENRVIEAVRHVVTIPDAPAEQP